MILESRKGTFIAEDPTSNSITLEVEFPFPVIRGFPLTPVEGIILNSSRLSQSDSPTPAVYLLKNPMEDILPIWMEMGNDPDRIMPPNGKVIHVGHVNKKTIIVMNDLKIFYLDKITEDELEMFQIEIQHRNEEEHFGSISHFGTGDHISNKSLKPGSRPMSTVTTPRTISPHPNSSKYRTPSSKKSTPNFTPRSKRTTNQSLLQGHRTPSSNRFKSFNQTGNTSSIFRKSAGNNKFMILFISIHSHLVSLMHQSTTFFDRTSQYVQSEFRQNLLWPSKILRPIQVDFDLGSAVRANCTVHDHTSILGDHFFIISNAESIFVVNVTDLNAIKVDEISEMVSVATLLAGYYVTVSKRNFVFIHTGTHQLAQINLNDIMGRKTDMPNRLVKQSTLTTNNVNTTPHENRTRLFSTPNLGNTKGKRKSLCVKTNAFSPVAPAMKSEFATPEISVIQGISLSNPTYGSFSITKKKTWRVELDLNRLTNEISAFFWNTLRKLDPKIYIQFTADWLVLKSTNKTVDFEQFLTFILDRCGIVRVVGQSDEQLAKRNRSDENIDDLDSVISKFWHSDLLSTLGVTKKDDLVLELDKQQSGGLPPKAIFKLLFLIYEEFSLSLYHEPEMVHLKETLLKICDLLDLDQFKSHLNGNLEGSDIPSIWNLAFALTKNISGNQMPESLTKIPITNLCKRTCCMLNLYMSVFTGFTQSDVYRVATISLKKFLNSDRHGC